MSRLVYDTKSARPIKVYKIAGKQFSSKDEIMSHYDIDRNAVERWLRNKRNDFGEIIRIETKVVDNGLFKTV